MSEQKIKGMASARIKAAEIIAAGGGCKGLPVQSKIMAQCILQSDSSDAAERFI